MPRLKGDAEVDPSEVESPHDFLVRIRDSGRRERPYCEEVCEKYALVDDCRRYHSWALKFKAVYFLHMMLYKREDRQPPDMFLRNYRAVMSDRVDRLDPELRILMDVKQEEQDMVKKKEEVGTVALPPAVRGSPVPRRAPPPRVAAAAAPVAKTKAVVKPVAMKPVKAKKEKAEGDGCPFRGNIAASYKVIVAAIQRGITDVDKLCTLLEKQNPPMPEGKPAISRLNYVMKKIDGVRLTAQTAPPKAKAAPAPKAKAKA